MVQITANEKTYRGIRDKLESGLLSPGDKLVTRRLATEFGVSLSPVREAINRLATEGLIEHTPGAGAQVRRLSLDDINELYVLRDAIESCAAGLAALNATESDLEELEYCVAEQAKIAKGISKSTKGVATKKQFLRWLRLEERYHETIVLASRNKLLSKVIRGHRTIANVFESQIGNVSILSTGVANSTVAGKKKLLVVFRRRDSESARSLMSQQIETGRKTVVDHLRKKKLQ